MTAHSPLEVPIVRWLALGIAIAVVSAYAVLTANLLLGALLVVLLGFFSLFYRLVVAVERIADQSATAETRPGDRP